MGSPGTPSASSPVAVVLLSWPHLVHSLLASVLSHATRTEAEFPAREELTQAGGLCKVTSLSACFLVGKRGEWEALSFGVDLGMGFEEPQYMLAFVMIMAKVVVVTEMPCPWEPAALALTLPWWVIAGPSLPQKPPVGTPL